MSITLRPKYRFIAEQLKTRIREGQIQSGDSLPSQSSLVEQYGVALGTVRQAINQLIADGWIRTEKGRGIFAGPQIRPEVELKSKTFGFVVLGPEQYRHDPVCLYHLNGLASVLQEAGKRLSYGVFSDEGIGTNKAFGEFLDEVSAIVLFHNITAEVLECVRSHKTRALLLGYPLRNIDDMFSGFSVISADMEHAGYLAGQALAIHGHRRIGLVYTMNTLADKVTHQGFERACREHSLEVPKVFVEEDRTAELDIAKRVSRDPDLTGVVVVGSMHAGRFVQDLIDLGVQVPKDKSVIAIGAKGLYRGVELTRLTDGETSMGAEAARLLLLPNAPATIRMLPGRFERGTTLAPPPRWNQS